MSQPVPSSAAVWWNLFQFFLYIGIAAGATVIGYMVYSVYKYRYREGQNRVESEDTEGEKKAKSEPTFRVQYSSHTRLAITFAIISGVILFGLAAYSFPLTTSIQYPPPASESLLIKVTAFQWSFRFEYPNGVTTVAVCRIPAGKPVIFNVTSSDVMHSFGLPDFRLKIDAIPGRYNTLWITAPTLNGQNEANYTIRCYELCGVGHTYMIANLIVMQPNAFNEWLANATKGG
jgi:cytochrome c oxidase subunit 2